MTPQKKREKQDGTTTTLKKKRRKKIFVTGFRIKKRTHNTNADASTATHTRRKR